MSVIYAMPCYNILAGRIFNCLMYCEIVKSESCLHIFDSLNQCNEYNSVD